MNKATKHDLVISLISGGGSALIPLPAKEITLEDMQQTIDQMMEAGANINELNAVRKHLSQLKGGQLAKAASPATMLNLIISDVVGDPPDVIASGPTAPDTSTFNDAKDVLQKYGLLSDVPSAVSHRIARGVKGEIPETPKPEDQVFNKVNNIIIANNRKALKGAARKARELGYNTRILSSYIEGEARDVGTVMGAIGMEMSKHESPLRKPLAVLGGGETTVTVTGGGRGGANQELALAAALKIEGTNDLLIGSIDTDGIDGNSEAAGAIVDGGTIPKARESESDPKDHLERNDSYTFFKKVGGLIVTGPTGTNVNDMVCIIVE